LGSSKTRHHAVLERQHLAVVGLMVVAAEVKHAVHDRLGEVLGVLGADHHVAELARTRDRPDLVDRKREHVGRAVDPAVLAVERVDLRGADEGDREVQVAPRPRRLEPGPRGRLEPRRWRRRVDDLDLDQARLRVVRSSGACCSA
jgi:hypothetical protein